MSRYFSELFTYSDVPEELYLAVYPNKGIDHDLHGTLDWLDWGI